MFLDSPIHETVPCAKVLIPYFTLIKIDTFYKAQGMSLDKYFPSFGDVFQS